MIQYDERGRARDTGWLAVYHDASGVLRKWWFTGRAALLRWAGPRAALGVHGHYPAPDVAPGEIWLQRGEARPARRAADPKHWYTTPR